jgi:flagellin FlaB
MFEPLLNNEERGQVGIGTLIVFIAMVLVAAIAAGVLINTAGFLQTQAEATGQESTEQVSDSLQVESVVSEVEGSAGSEQIRAIAIDVSLAPGSNPIDITSATLEWIGSDNSAAATYAIVAGDPASVSDSNINVLADNQNFQTELTSESDTARIYLAPPKTGSGGENSVTALDMDLVGGTDSFGGVSELPLSAGAEAQVTITAPGGGQTTVAIRVPDVLVSGEGVRL